MLKDHVVEEARSRRCISLEQDGRHHQPSVGICSSNFTTPPPTSSSTRKTKSSPPSMPPALAHARETVRLAPGESISLQQRCYHKFWAGRVLVGEVSLVNDDQRDNRFYEPTGRFRKSRKMCRRSTCCVTICRFYEENSD